MSLRSNLEQRGSHQTGFINDVILSTPFAQYHMLFPLLPIVHKNNAKLGFGASIFKQ